MYGKYVTRSEIRLVKASFQQRFSKVLERSTKKKPAFDVVAGSGSAVDVLLVQAHTNQTWVLLWHPALQVLSKQDKPRTFLIAILKTNTRGHSPL